MNQKACAQCGVEAVDASFPKTSSGHRRGVCRPCITMRNRCRARGISVDQYLELRSAQDNRCALCGEPEVLGRELAIDHDHETNQVRGLLCFVCNTRLAWVEGAFLNKALLYLSKGGHAIDNSEPIQLTMKEAA